MKTLFPLITFLAFSSIFTHAQESMGLYLASRYGGSSLTIEKLSMDVSVTNDIAVTTLDFTFFNEMDHLLEGDFKLPLQEGQSVYHLALEVGNTLREASVVEKNQGRESFEAIARRKVDPALLEKTAGNIYTTKIYPIPRKGTRRVVIGLEETLRSKNSSFDYQFPLNFSGVIEDFHLSVSSENNEFTQIHIGDEPISLDYSNPEIGGHFSKKDFKSGELLSISIPKASDSTNQVRVEKNRATGEVYFSANMPLKNAIDSKPPSNVLLLWDSSYSGIKRKHKEDVDLILEYLSTLKRTTIELICFDLENHPSRTFKTTKEGLQNLRSALTEIQYGGATRWKSLDLGNHPSDRVLLVTDGISTLGDAEPELPSAPIYAINSSVQADHEFLNRLCETSGGHYINAQADTHIEAIEKLNLPPLPHASIQVASGEIEHLTTRITHDEKPSLWISGRLRSEQATLKVQQSISGNKTVESGILIRESRATKSKGMIERLWARAVFSAMPKKRSEDRERAIEFAKRHKIVTAFTSLIVLEQVFDYVHYKVDPPKDLLEQYKRAMETTRKPPEFELDEKIEEVVSIWEERIEWYETSFNKALAATAPEPTEYLAEDAKPPMIPWSRPAEWDQPIEESEADQIIQEAEDSIQPPTHNIALNVPHTPHYTKSNDENGADVYSLSPFTVEEESYIGYTASMTMAGSRVRTNFRDVAHSISIVTEEFMEDVGAIDLISYAGTIEVAGIVSDEEYYQKLEDAPTESLDALYYDLRDSFSNSPSYFFDAAAIFAERGKRKEAIRILTSVLDLAPGDYLFQRAVGRTLVQMLEAEYAVEALLSTKDSRRFEPQSYFDLGVAQDASGNHQDALETLYHIITMPGSWRFDEIEVIALMEINRIIQLHGSCLDTSFIDQRLIYPMPMDLRITLSWNTDDTDVDLHVTDPSQQKCFYLNDLTKEGGLLSRDITEGYGPEEFLLRKASDGRYKIQAHYFGTDEQGQLLPVILNVQITKNFSRPTEESETVTLRLEEEDDLIHLGDIVL